MSIYYNNEIKNICAYLLKCRRKGKLMLRLFKEAHGDWMGEFKVAYIVSDEILTLAKHLDDFKIEIRTVDNGIAIESNMINSISYNDIKTGCQVDFNIFEKPTAIILEASSPVPTLARFHVSLDRDIDSTFNEELRPGFTFYAENNKGEQTIILVTLTLNGSGSTKYLDIDVETLDGDTYELLAVSTDHHMVEEGQLLIRDKSNAKIRNLTDEVFIEDRVGLPLRKVFEDK